MMKSDQERMERVARAMDELIKYFGERGEFFVFTLAFKKTHELEDASMLTMSGYTDSVDLNLYEAMAMMNKDLIDMVFKDAGGENFIDNVKQIC